MVILVWSIIALSSAAFAICAFSSRYYRSLRMTRGNQRDLDRAKAQAKAAATKEGKNISLMSLCQSTSYVLSV
jgi:hypothetical protein